MARRSVKRLADTFLQVSIGQILDVIRASGSGIVPIGTAVDEARLAAWVEHDENHILFEMAVGWGNVEQRIELSETPCHFGGKRNWFLCPCCERRCGVLYIGKHVACRICHDLMYECQFEAPRDRTLRRLKKIRRLIGAGMELGGPLNPPPKGMSLRRWRALIEDYNRLREAYYIESRFPRKWKNDAPRGRR
ncbi:hypothetical protein GCM10011517_26560 [Actibacterium pelagium]|uniref:Uncharacterized protein n=1 Tax=Actibacterium pelagium TaxID=2029103 RepID=A0A917AJF9_9RHOB|nr:hypothetical protein GCM10011517_26560 [Actibacterium pelagium]